MGPHPHSLQASKCASDWKDRPIWSNGERLEPKQPVQFEAFITALSTQVGTWLKRCAYRVTGNCKLNPNILWQNRFVVRIVILRSTTTSFGSLTQNHH